VRLRKARRSQKSASVSDAVIPHAYNALREEVILDMDATIVHKLFIARLWPLVSSPELANEQ
jgi:hypothetical protein